MKIYKKLATLAPMAVLGSSLLLSPSMTFAAEKQEPSKSVQTQNQLSTAVEFGGDTFEIPPHSLVTITYKTDTGIELLQLQYDNDTDSVKSVHTPKKSVMLTGDAKSITNDAVISKI
ncbi:MULTISPECIES: hypothetical protein [Bacillus]|uniref:Uncharacterized protein n=1 Tax=Bacillus cereus TaxID=1396 RepID=A0A9X6B2S8_BACCE|nr:hypothetical protein [Bacillus cereus]OOR71097.1 hypothetical protein BLX06_32705 [Bacillus cereus]